MTLSEIKQNLNGFQFVHCGLSHEAVLLDRKSNLPVKNEISDENIYKRVDLCSLIDRKQRLGCAHSSANDTFNKLIDELPEKDFIIEKFRKQFNELIFQIYMLDHKKGNLEKNFAEAIDPSNSCELSSSNIQKELDACKHTHSIHIDQLSEIRSCIIQRIDKLIELN